MPTFVAPLVLKQPSSGIHRSSASQPTQQQQKLVHEQPHQSLHQLQQHRYSNKSLNLVGPNEGPRPVVAARSSPASASLVANKRATKTQLGFADTQTAPTRPRQPSVAYRPLQVHAPVVRMKHVTVPQQQQQQPDNGTAFHQNADSFSHSSHRRRTAYILPVPKTNMDATVAARLARTPSLTGLYHEPFYGPVHHNVLNKHFHGSNSGIHSQRYVPRTNTQDAANQQEKEEIDQTQEGEDQKIDQNQEGEDQEIDQNQEGEPDECIDRIELITVGKKGCNTCALQQRLINDAGGEMYGLVYIDKTENPHHEACAVPHSKLPYHVYCEGTGDDRVCTWLFDGVATVEQIFARAAALSDVCPVD